MCLGTVYSYSVFRMPIEELFDIGSTYSGMPYMMALAFYAIFMFLTGKVLDRFHPRSILLCGGMLVAMGWSLSSMATSIPFLTLTYGVMSGAGVGIAYGVPLTVVARWFPDMKGLAVGMVLIGFGLSPIVTAPLSRMLVDEFGVMQAFLILGISFGVIITALSFVFKYPPKEVNPVHPNDAEAFRSDHIKTSEMIQSHSFKGLYLNFVIGTMIGLMLIGLTSMIGTNLFGMSTGMVALSMSVFAIFNGLGRPIFGWIADKVSVRAAMLISYSMIAMSALLLLLTGRENTLIYPISFSIFWFNLGGWLAIAPTSTLVLYGTKHYSQNYGLVFTAYGIGALVGVISSGLILDAHGNYYYLFAYIIALCLIGVFFTFRFIKSRRRSI